MKYYKAFLEKYKIAFEQKIVAIPLESEVPKVPKVEFLTREATFDTFDTSLSRQSAENENTFSTFSTLLSRETTEKEQGQKVGCAWCGGALSLETYDVMKVFYCSLGCDDVRRRLTCTDEILDAFETEIINTATPDEVSAMCDEMDELRARIMLDTNASDDDSRRLAEQMLLPVWLDNYFLRRKIMWGRKAIL